WQGRKTVSEQGTTLLLQENTTRSCKEESATLLLQENTTRSCKEESATLLLQEFKTALSELSVATRDESTPSATKAFVSRWLERQIRISKYGDSYPVRPMRGMIFFFPDGANRIRTILPNRRAGRLV
ncbi:MAG: hypothetical protein WCJ25_05590, partial [Candidatus Moraniibacteriota bacterium]